MKIKLKQSASFQKLLPFMLSVGLLFLSFFLLKTGEGLSLGEFWSVMLSRAHEKDFFVYALMIILPGLVLIAVALAVYHLLRRYFFNRSANPFVEMNFGPDGVLLEKKNARGNVFLPYSETDLSVEVQTTIQYDKYGNAHWAFGGFKLSFSQQGNTFSVFHQAGLAFLQTILDEGKKFKSCTAHAQPLNPRTAPNEQEQQFIRFLEEQFENHRRYGVILKDFPQKRWMLLVAGIIYILTASIIFAVLLGVLPRLHAYPIFYIVLGLLAAGPLLLSGYFLKKYWTGRTAAKRLQNLKNKSLE